MYLCKKQMLLWLELFCLLPRVGLGNRYWGIHSGGLAG